MLYEIISGIYMKQMDQWGFNIFVNVFYFKTTVSISYSVIRLIFQQVLLLPPSLLPLPPHPPLGTWSSEVLPQHSYS